MHLLHTTASSSSSSFPSVAPKGIVELFRQVGMCQVPLDFHSGYWVRRCFCRECGDGVGAGPRRPPSKSSLSTGGDGGWTWCARASHAPRWSWRRCRWRGRQGLRRGTWSSRTRPAGRLAAPADSWPSWDTFWKWRAANLQCRVLWQKVRMAGFLERRLTAPPPPSRPRLKASRPGWEAHGGGSHCVFSSNPPSAGWGRTAGTDMESRSPCGAPSLCTCSCSVRAGEQESGFAHSPGDSCAHVCTSRWERSGGQDG